jgi:hypothetical protein
MSMGEAPQRKDTIDKALLQPKAYSLMDSTEPGKEMDVSPVLSKACLSMVLSWLGSSKDMLVNSSQNSKLSSSRVVT